MTIILSSLKDSPLTEEKYAEHEGGGFTSV